MTENQTKNAIRAEILRRHGFRNGREALDKIPWESMNGSMAAALKCLLQGRNSLRQAYQKHLENTNAAQRKSEMTFALDGRLVGDIGELIAAEVFCLELLGTRSRDIDAETTSGPTRKVQVKVTFQSNGLCIRHGEDYYLGLQLDDDGRFRVIYNGPATLVMGYLKAPKSTGHKGRANAGRKLEPLTLETWAALNLDVAGNDRIVRREQRKSAR